MPTRRQYLLIDGYNVAHAWPDVLKVMERDIDTAASMLAGIVAVLHDPEKCEVTVVFDGRSDRVDIQRSAKMVAPCVIYAPAGKTADAIIEQIVANAPDAEAFTVATRDNALSLSVYSRNAHVITPDELLEWVRREHKEVERTILKRARATDAGFGNKLFK